MRYVHIDDNIFYVRTYMGMVLEINIIRSKHKQLCCTIPDPLPQAAMLLNF